MSQDNCTCHRQEGQAITCPVHYPESVPYAGIICHGHGGEATFPSCGKVDPTKDEYMFQMNRPDALWHCPRCMGYADFDDDRYETINFPEG